MVPTKCVLMRKILSGFVHVPWTWFCQPIIATSAPLSSFGYDAKACPVSENVGAGMVNLPCNLCREEGIQMAELFKNALRVVGARSRSAEG